MKKAYLILVGVLLVLQGFGQQLNEPGNFILEVLDDKERTAEGVSIYLISVPDSSIQKTVVTDKKGIAMVDDIPPGAYVFKFTAVGYQVHVSPVYTFPVTSGAPAKYTVTLIPATATMQDVTVVGSRPFVQHVQGKVL